MGSMLPRFYVKRIFTGTAAGVGIKGSMGFGKLVGGWGEIAVI